MLAHWNGEVLYLQKAAELLKEPLAAVAAGIERIRSVLDGFSGELLGRQKLSEKPIVIVA